MTDQNTPENKPAVKTRRKKENDLVKEPCKRRPAVSRKAVIRQANEQLRNLMEPDESSLKLPMIPMRGLVVFPGVTLSFDIGREGSSQAVKAAMADNQQIFLSAQKSPDEDWPDPDEIYVVGSIARIRQILELPGENMKIMVEGRRRARIVKLKQSEPFYTVQVESLPNEEPDTLTDLRHEAARRLLLRTFESYALISNRIPPEAIIALSEVMEPGVLADSICGHMNLPFYEKQHLLETADIPERVCILTSMINREQKLFELERDIDTKVKVSIEKSQRDYFLREQMKTIQNELGEQEGTQKEQENFLELLKKSQIPDEFREKVAKEISRLARMPSGYPEASVLRSWVELLFELPFGKTDTEKLDLARARKILDRDHYGLEKVKERILEYLAVLKLRIEAGDQSIKGPILCLVGPPGVGKTSIARSVAEALGRKYVRMSLGGIRDEAEIRGHRRTYVGAMPGRIINAIRQAGRDNPLILLDEIDKLGSDYRGDPSSALLEVLDPEQNNSFRDHYLEIPYDLSKVLFITTANSNETIPQALLDRMETVSLSGYTEAEKIEIAVRHLLPHQLKQNALKKNQLSISKAAMAALISGYTREAGVRQLERELAHVCRRTAIRIAENKEEKVKVRPENLEDLIGRKRFHFEMASEKDLVGMATGLAWTYAGGDTLTIEVNVMPGSGRLELTGQLGDVMKESARAAVTYIRSRAQDLNISDDFASKKDIHIHVPAGATPKDGPSAGITLATALASALSNRPVRHNVAMTGEITLRGRILPIGGLKEKVIAANRAGIDTVLIPAENQRDILDIPLSVKEKIKLIPVNNMDQVFENALLPAANLEQISPRPES